MARNSRRPEPQPRITRRQKNAKAFGVFLVKPFLCNDASFKNL
jgi:hypothetical protein